MNNKLATVSMTSAFIVAGALSASCANVTTAISSFSFWSEFQVQLSFADSTVAASSRAGSIPHDASVDDPESETTTLVSDGLLRSGGGVADSQTGDSNDKARGFQAPEGRCKNGNHVGNKHCIPSPSE